MGLSSGFRSYWLYLVLIQVVMLVALTGFSPFAIAEDHWQGLYQGETIESVSLEQALSQIEPGTILVLGENHGFAEHQSQHLMILREIRRRGLSVSLGMEFLDYPTQPFVDEFLACSLREEEFLQKVGWGGVSFNFYRDQIRFPNWDQGGRTYALNIPRFVTNVVMRKGMGSLSEEQRALLPPDFELGNSLYRDRFQASIPHEIPPEKLENWFAAQSLWDDTMAWRAGIAMRENPHQVLVIIVGEFHVAYGGGLPDRLRKRWGGPILTFSQFNSLDLGPQEVKDGIFPHAKYGKRADYIWVAEAKQGPEKQE